MISADKYKEKCDILANENVELKSQIEQLSERVNSLNAQIKWFQKQIFGSKSERRIEDVPKEQLWLGEQFQQETAEAETQTVAAHERKKRKTESVDGDKQNLFFDETVPVEEIKIANPEVEGLSENEYEVVSQKTTYRLAQRPGAYVILKYIRDVIKIKNADKKAVKMSCPAVKDSVFDKCHADVSFLVGLLIDKFQYHLPLYRQHLRLESAGIKVSRAWLTQLVHRCGDLLEPVYLSHLDWIRKSRVKLMDETPIKAGREKKGKMRDAYFWPVMAGDKDIVFLFFESREHRHVFEALGTKPEENSVVVSDGYGAYAAYAKATNTFNGQCWTHARREFLKAEESEPEKVKEALELMRPLWKVEKEIREQGLEGEAKRLYRIEHSKPLVDAFFKWVDEQQKSGLFLPKNPFSKALQYANKREEMLRLFITDSEVPLDTNDLERALRVIPMGRKNWMFCWTEIGAKYVGIIQSLIATCKMRGIDPYTYLVDILQRVSEHPKTEIEKLTPRLWEQNFASNPLRSDLDFVVSASR